MQPLPFVDVICRGRSIVDPASGARIREHESKARKVARFSRVDETSSWTAGRIGSASYPLHDLLADEVEFNRGGDVPRGWDPPGTAPGLARLPRARAPEQGNRGCRPRCTSRHPLRIATFLRATDPGSHILHAHACNIKGCGTSRRAESKFVLACPLCRYELRRDVRPMQAALDRLSAAQITSIELRELGRIVT